MSSEPVRITPEQAAERLLRSEDILIMTHRRPDGDTVGCAAALCIALRSLGKTAYVFAKNEYIDRLVPYVEGLLQPEGFVPGYRVSVDIAAPRLFPYGAEELAELTDLSFDHHLDSGTFAKELCADSSCAACAEIMYDVLNIMGCINAGTALPLYMAIATDTGCFRYSNTTARTHRTAALLMEQGIDIAPVNTRMFESKTRERLQLEAMLVSNAGFYDDGTVAVGIISDEMVKKAGSTPDDEDDIANVLRSVQGVMAAITIREQEGGKKSKVSVRTQEGSISAQKVCALFSGGGHIRASGCSINVSPEKAAELMLAAVRQVRDE